MFLHVVDGVVVHAARVFFASVMVHGVQLAEIETLSRSKRNIHWVGSSMGDIERFPITAILIGRRGRCGMKPSCWRRFINVRIDQ